ncbi:hypothetical protein MPQ_1673 [Methylovorus sp. MP688]|nr:hypothetical protein MPQ_1673 [Methylovorus sp. MP688]
MVQPLLLKGIGQCAHHMFLSDQRFEQLWAPFPGKNLITHKAGVYLD